ncbi:MAG: transcription-repair coupling factor [Gammaproteobacteria bacterium]|nr:transcription-repair coupling factor [Gammaproteobacteria bacterium]
MTALPDHSPFSPKTAVQQGGRLHWCGLEDDAIALAISQIESTTPGPILVIATTAAVAQQLADSIHFYEPETELSLFPDWEVLPYDNFSPHQDLISDRLSTLARLPTLQRGLIITTVATSMQRLPPKRYIDSYSLQLDRNEAIQLEQLQNRFENAGYRRVIQVLEHGEYAIRGGLVDVFAMGGKTPYRIELFDDLVESIRTFDPETQRSTGQVEHIRLLPAREYPIRTEDRQLFLDNFRTRFGDTSERQLIYQAVEGGGWPAGIEFYLPLFYPQLDTLFDYLPASTTLVRIGAVAETVEASWASLAQRYEEKNTNLSRQLLSPGEIALPPDELHAKSKSFCRIEIVDQREGQSTDYATTPPPELLIENRVAAPLRRLTRFLDDYPGRVLLTTDSEGRRETLLELLRKHRVSVTPVEAWADFLAGSSHTSLAVAPLQQGFVLHEPALAVIPERLLRGEQVMQQRRRGHRHADISETLRDLTELNPGDPVVHEQHGVGRYLGLKSLTLDQMSMEFVTLEYAGGDKLYVPVAALDQIHRYAGAGVDHAPLHRLGGEQWERIKRRAREKIHDVAVELLDIYARRAARSGFAYPAPNEEYERFSASFPFEETPDQTDTIAAVLTDMQSDQPMDRVVCGDVGFGKTEVAMRAAFFAVQGGKQVAVLVPTTLLTQQHAESFRTRFAEWPVRIEALSRLRSVKQTNEIQQDLAAGKIDIIIGTHRLLQKDFHFHSLGLTIIDEEHRFGVRQKEHMRSLRAEVDTLALTATPIPRTLSMALSSLRDLSIIATPPQRRLAVKTFVEEWQPEHIREACLREFNRGGQVYFLHNQVESIDAMAEDLARLIPEARIEVGHGQLPARELEQVMRNFYHQRCNLLVSSTIIESGIDVPNANTILINRADKLGLAQLHQLRGRVGRSHHQAYAYLLIPPRKSLKKEALQRLEAVESLHDLGSGFTLATQDLEIRGAGELLGGEQSGQMESLGFTLYNELLERTVNNLRNGTKIDLDEPLHRELEVNFHVPTLIPEDYMPDIHGRLVHYKRIANANTTNELNELKVELIDRFGALPEPLQTLFVATDIKLEARALGIKRVDAPVDGIRIEFEAEPRINHLALIELIQRQPHHYRMQGQSSLKCLTEQPELNDRIESVRALLVRLSP